MDGTVHYDLDEHLLSPAPDVAYQVLSDCDSPDLFDLSTTDSQSYTDPSQNSSNSSPEQSKSYSPGFSLDSVGLNFNENEIIDISLETQLTEKLQIIAQPKAFYRERYCSETDPSKHRAQRFIRADDEDNISRHEYPTVQIPAKWRDPTHDLYIRVTLVTIFSDKVPVVCIHPYAIDTQENNVLHDLRHNSLYFPINQEEMFRGQKSFRISRKKMIQHDLRSYGPMHLFDLNEDDIQRVANSYDAKQVIEIYQLWRSQLVFTIAQRLDDHMLPVPIRSTSVTSQIMCDEGSGRRKDSLTPDILSTNLFEDDSIICTPRKGDWCGGDNVLMIIPKLDKRKAFHLYFDYGSMGIADDIQVSFVDTKTIFFQTPSCSMLEAGQNLIVPLLVIQNDLILVRVEFVYLAPIKTTINICSNCQDNMINNQRMSNKRRHLLSDLTELDGGDTLVQQMSRLTTEETPANSLNPTASNDKSSKFDKYLGQLQEALVEYIRTNNPSRLFRRTRLLIAKCEENPPPMDDAIRRDHIDLALKLIEQSIDMPSTPNGLLERENTDGETPLLLAAKLNHWILIEAIVPKRLDLTEQTDKSNNNMLHLLANVSEDKAHETIKNVLALIPDDLRLRLLKAKNKDDQTPSEIAQIKNNNHCMDLLNTSHLFC